MELEPIISQNAVSVAVVDQLGKTKGWTRFMSVLLWIGVALMVIAALVMIGIGGMGGAAGEAIGMGLLGGGMLGAIYIVMAGLYVYPALKLWKFSNHVRDLIAAPTENNLVQALTEQRRFWKFVGIWMIVIFSIYVLIIVIAIFTGMAATLAA